MFSLLLMYTRITIYGLVKKSVMPLFIFWISLLLDLELNIKDNLLVFRWELIVLLLLQICFFIPAPHNSGGVLWFHVGRPWVRPSVHPSVCHTSVRPSVFRFRMITWVNINEISPNLVCALFLWRSGLGLLMGKFSSIFDGVICPRHANIFVSGL